MRFTIFLLLTFAFKSAHAMACSDLTTSNDGFHIRGVYLQDCFTIPSMGKEYTYKFSKVCLSGSLDRAAYTQLKDGGKFRPEVQRTVRSLHEAKIEKVPCD